MKKKLLLLVVIVMSMLVLAGCGSEKYVGDWIFKGKNMVVGGDELKIIHIEKADNGKYVLSGESRAYRQDYVYTIDRDTKEKIAVGKDGAINAKDVFTWRDKYFGMVEGTWNGQPLKLRRIYKLHVNKPSNIGSVTKEQFTLKDGKLLFFNNFYEKADKTKIDKLMSDWKENLKKEVGAEREQEIFSVKGKVKTVIAQVIIKENGKEEVFEVK